MALFVMQRDRVVSTLSGHVIRFVKGAPVHVPPAAIRECMSMGAVPVDGEVDIPDATEEKTVTIDGDALSFEDRKKAIFDAFTFLKGRNARGDFGADGRPHPKAISQKVGFTVDSKERNALWSEYLEQDE
jgi:hypothetical protein